MWTLVPGNHLRVGQCARQHPHRVTVSVLSSHALPSDPSSLISCFWQKELLESFPSAWAGEGAEAQLRMPCGPTGGRGGGLGGPCPSGSGLRSFTDFWDHLFFYFGKIHIK